MLYNKKNGNIEITVESKGAELKALLKDGEGKSLKPYVFNGVIPNNKYFVSGIHPKSWDSRYFGFIDKNRIIATAKGLI